MFKPINGYVAVEKLKVTKTASGFALPDDLPDGGGSAPGDGNKQPVINGKVIAVSDESTLKVGDIISYRQTTVFEIENKETLEKVEIIKEEHIFGIWQSQN